MRKLRSILDIWHAVDSQRPEGMNKVLWKQSHAGIAAALLHVGLVLKTTRQELDAMPIPLDKDGRQNTAYRKVQVMRNGILSQPVDIKSLLSGNSALKTDAEP